MKKQKAPQEVSKKKLVQSRGVQIVQELIRNAKSVEEIHAITKMLRKADKEKSNAD